MDGRIEKLQTRLKGLGLDQDIPGLVRAGFDTPARIRAASDADLLAVPGIGRRKLAVLRAAFPPQQ